MRRSLLALSIACADLASACAPEACPPSTRSQGLIVLAAPQVIVDIQGAGVCADVQIRCTPDDFSTDFARGCERYQLLPRRAGECTVKVTLSDGETIEHAIAIVDRTGEACENQNSFYAANTAEDVLYVAPSSGDAGSD